MDLNSPIPRSYFIQILHSDKDTWIRTLAYVSPQIGMVLIATSTVSVLGGIYAKYFGLSLTSIATVMLVARIFDAVTDPLIVITLTGSAPSQEHENLLFYLALFY